MDIASVLHSSNQSDSVTVSSLCDRGISFYKISTWYPVKKGIYMHTHRCAGRSSCSQAAKEMLSMERTIMEKDRKLSSAKNEGKGASFRNQGVAHTNVRFVAHGS